MRVLAIDFGTSNTVAMLRAADGRARPLIFDSSPLLPSAVCLDAAGRLLTGGDAQRAARLDPARAEPNPKRRVDDAVVLLGDRELPVTRVIGAVLARVAGEAHRQLGAACDEVRLTHPAHWGPRRRAVLLAAAQAAGLPAPRLVAEPVAAASYYTAVLDGAWASGRALAVYDLGGGTFDAAVVRRGPDGFTVLAEDGLADLGGVDFDQALVEHLGRGYAGTRTGLWQGLLSPADVGQRRQRALLYDDVRAAKESLSRATSADVHLPALDVAAHLTRHELEDLIRARLQQTVDCLARTVAAAGVGPAELAGVFLVGGSSRVPLAARLVHATLGVAPTTLEQPETVVAEGALYFGAAGPAAPGRSHSGVPRTVVLPPVPPAAPVAGAAHPIPAVSAPRPVVAPAAVTSPPHRRAWYREPLIVGTLVLAVLVIVALVVLLALLTGA